ncbi:antitoxin VbhA family protein [Microbacterium amylolyticum]|uniref:Antitoxin VbhA domain-containing protein n=1 Tax=Microbacterium amylolyticum TaxID=936337 RepID=A0ABS4ZI26_9MICO|nr:antitoxin VbhA family protein [Microbacterium amylolyticum]MBP2436934.1 hypothetical protein [Microbacterium amylolyticum]MBP2437886.1 hypothetical protein [Microbacterium amylolyticum]
MAGCDVVALWPDLFVDLDEDRQDLFRQTFASQYLSGWEPNRADVVDLLELKSGAITRDEYTQRIRSRA